MTLMVESLFGVHQLDSLQHPVRGFCSGREFSNDRHSHFLRQIGLEPAQLQRVRQTHSNQVLLMDRHEMITGQVEADALVTSLNHTTIGILTADCIPAFFWDPMAKRMGLAHAGWRGLYAGILENTLKLFLSEGSRAQDVQVTLGPCIRSCCYQVGPEFRNYFPQSTYERGGLIFTDLCADAKARLSALGVPSANFFDTYVCTACQNHAFFSARRDKTANRILSVMTLNF